MNKYQEYQTSWIKEWRRSNREHHMFRVARSSCNKTGLAFNIEVSDIVIPETCPILGTPIFFSEDKRTDNTPSLDKVCPEKGYIKGNVQVISWKANRLKNNASLEELVLLGKWAESEISSTR